MYDDRQPCVNSLRCVNVGVQAVIDARSAYPTGSVVELFWVLGYLTGRRGF